MLNMATQSGDPKIIKEFVADAHAANDLANVLFKKPEEQE